MHVLGLVGGIASGKSTVAHELAQLGAAVLDADRAAHGVINLPEVRQLLRDRWGDGVVLPTGHIDRAAVAERVFAADAAQELAFLQETLHPRIRQDFAQRLAQLEDTPVAVIDAPLLLEAGWQDLCHSLIFVACPLDERRERALRRGWTADQFVAREAAQMPIDQKRQAADYILQTGASSPALPQQIRTLWDDLADRAAKSLC